MSPTMTRLSLALLALATVPSPVAAQENAADEIKAIFRLVEKDLDEIDRLLLSFDPAGAARRMDAANKGIQKILDKVPPAGGKGGEGGAEGGKASGGAEEGAGAGGSVKKVLEKAEARQSAVINGIQRILDKVPQGKGGKGSPDKKDKKEPGQQQDKERGHDNPDYEKQQQEERERQQQQGQPQGNKQNPESGVNQDAKGPPPDNAKAQANRDELDRLWGELPEYQRMQMMKKGQPQIPERYRRFYDEFIRRSAKTSGK